MSSEPYVLVKMSCVDYNKVCKIIKRKELAREKAREVSRLKSGREIVPRKTQKKPISMEVIETHAPVKPSSLNTI